MPPKHSGGPWTESVLHSFGGGNDGSHPAAGLVLDADDNLYGTTTDGGSGNGGIVFQLSPTHSGWTKKTLHHFAGADGFGPSSELIIDGAGNLFGTTTNGGSVNRGVAFELVRPGPGTVSWTELLLYDFTRQDGFQPNGVIFGADGNLYGTTQYGGPRNVGTVFRLTPPANGSAPWKITTLFSFRGGMDGKLPLGNVLLDDNGVLYGATYLGGASGDGTAFRLVPPARGNKQWDKTILHDFYADSSSDGAFPNGGLVLGKGGKLYGTSASGGDLGWGTVFELAP